MLHEEVELRWDDLQTIVQDFQLLEHLRLSVPINVSNEILNCNLFNLNKCF